MGDSLFREEVGLAGSLQSYGQHLRSPKAHGAYAALAVGAVVLGVAFVCLAPYTRRERCEGLLVSAEGAGHIVSPASGIVRELKLHPGQLVRKNQALFTVSGEQETSLGESRGAIKQQLEREQGYLVEQINQIELGRRKEKERLLSQGSALREEALLLENEERQSDLLAQERVKMLDAMRPLQASGYVAAVQVQDMESQVGQARIQASGLHRSRIQVIQQSADCAATLSKIETDAASQTAQLRREIARVRESILENELALGTVVKADEDGFISDVSVPQGTHVAAGDHVLTLRPAGTEMIARLFVSSAAIGLVKPGTVVSVRLAAYPYQKYGVQKGIVTMVAKAPIGVPEIANQLGQQSANERMYVVDARLARPTSSLKGTDISLISGMRIEAELLLEKRTMLEWLFEPLLGFKNAHA